MESIKTAEAKKGLFITTLRFETLANCQVTFGENLCNLRSPPEREVNDNMLKIASFRVHRFE